MATTRPAGRRRDWSSGETNTHYLNFRMTEAHATFLRREASKSDRSVSYVVREIISKEMERRGHS